MKPPSNVKTPAQYISSLPADRAKTIATVRALVNKHIPRGYDECLVWGTIGWTIPLSRYPDTYNKQPICYVALSSQKNYCSLYLIIADNTAISWGGGLDTYTPPTIANSIVSGNTQAPSGDINTVGSITDNGGNLINLRSAAIQLSPLDYYGGPTPTMVPLPGSPAIQAATGSASSTTDQRGAARPTTGPIDSGAVQTSYALAFTTEPPATAYLGTPFSAALILSENGSPFPVSRITLPLNVVLNGNSTALPSLTTDSTGLAAANITLNTVGTGYTLVSTLPLTPSTITPAAAITATSTSFDVDLNPVTLTAAVTPSSSYNNLKAPPTVIVTLTPSNATGITPAQFAAILDGSTSLTVISTGTNIFTLAGIPSNLAAGPHNIQVTFSGTDIYAPASLTIPLTAISQALDVTAANATRVYGAPNPVFTGTITGAVNGDIFTKSFSTTATLSSNAGAYPIIPTAIGPNLSDYIVKTTNGTLTIARAATITTLTTPAANVGPGVSLTLTATVASSTTGTPTGTVAFFNGSTQLGTSTLDSTGSATLTASFSVIGAASLTAVYAGDTNFTGSNSTVVPVAIVAPGFTITANPTTLTLTPGQTGQITVTLTPVGDLSGQVSLNCTIPKVLLTCAFSPKTATFNGDNAVQSVALTVGTYGPSNINQILQSGSKPSLSMIWWLPAALLGGLLTLARRRLSTPLHRLLLVLLLAAAAFGASGCGSGFTYTAPGTNTITITATGPETSPQALNLTIIVQ